MSRRAWMAFGLLLPVLTGCGREKPHEKPPIPVRAQTVESYAERGGVRYSATIKPDTQVELAFRVGGYIREIFQIQGADGRSRAVQEGDAVAKDTVLARVRETDHILKVSQAKSQLAEAQAVWDQARSQLAEARAAWDQARSQLAEAQAAWDQTRVDFDRVSALFASRSVTKSDYDAAKARLEISQARTEAARAQLNLSQARVDGARAQLQIVQAKTDGARAQLEEAELALQDAAAKAPIDAVILKRTIEVGALVAPGTVAFVLADINSVKAVFGVPDFVLENLRLGTPITVTTEAIPGVRFPGRITRVSPSADPTSRVFEAELTISNPHRRLKPGMIASLEVAGPALPKPLPVVPLSAIVRPKNDLSGYAVYVVEDQGGRQVARARPVKLGEVFGNRIAVTDGVRLGERVVVTGTTLAVDGHEVKVIP